MRRGLLNFLTAVSLLLGVASALLWVRGQWVADAVNWVGVRRDPASATGAPATVRSLTLAAGDGAVSVLWVWASPDAAGVGARVRPGLTVSGSDDPSSAYTPVSVTGESAGRGRAWSVQDYWSGSGAGGGKPVKRVRFFRFPIALPVFTFFLPPVVWAGCWLRWRWRTTAARRGFPVVRAETASPAIHVDVGR